MKIANVTELLKEHARTYTRMDDLLIIALKSGLVKDPEDFNTLVTKYLNQHPDGQLEDGWTFYTELPFAPQKTKVTMKGTNIGMIRILPPPGPPSPKHS